MPSVAGNSGDTMSISPRESFWLFLQPVASRSSTFNGADPITKYTGVLHSSETFLEFGWDKDNHLYALSTTNLHVYRLPPQRFKEVSGSPYSIPEASSVIVLTLQ